MVLALVQRHAHAPVRQQLEQRRAADRAVAQRQSGAEALRRVGDERAVKLGLVDLGNVPRRAHQRMAERTVIGHKQQALGVLVEPPDREQAAPQALGEQLQHGAVPLVAARRDDAGRLVEHIVALRAIGLLAPVERHAVRIRIDLGCGVALRRAVHRNAACTDEALHFFSAAAVQVTEQLVQSYLRHFVSPANRILNIV